LDRLKIYETLQTGKMDGRDIRVDGKVILRRLSGKYCVDLIHLVRDMDQW
jgi:hypothetical protein